MPDVLHADPAVTCQWDIMTPDVQRIDGGGCNLCVTPDGCGIAICTERCTGYPCGAVSRFVVERSDGDESFGWDGKHETCEEHLAEVAASMIDDDENVCAIVAIRWDGGVLPQDRNGDRTMSVEQVTREAQIVYITEWASRYRCSLQLNGQVGFGRDCVGVLKGDTYIDYEDHVGIWTPEDAYHKHYCIAVLGHGDEALTQLYEWVKWLDENGWGVEEVYRQPTSNIDLAFHGISTPKLVRLPSSPAPRTAEKETGQ